MDDIAQHPSGPEPSVGDTSATVRLVPVTETYVVPVPWYKRMFGPVTRTETVWKLTFLSIMIVGVIVGQSMLQTPTNTVTQAAVGAVRVSLFPQTTEIPPDRPFQLWMTADKPIKKAKIVLSFDPAVLQLSRDITLIEKIGYILSVSQMAQANATGMIEISILPKPGALTLSPGTIQIGSLFLTAKPKNIVASTTISIDEVSTVIENQDSVPFSLSTTNVVVALK